MWKRELDHSLHDVFRVAVVLDQTLAQIVNDSLSASFFALQTHLNVLNHLSEGVAKGSKETQPCIVGPPRAFSSLSGKRLPVPAPV